MVVRTSAEVLQELIGDPKLRVVLLAQKDNYGGTPASGISFGLQAMVMRHYSNGAYYPVGAPGPLPGHLGQSSSGPAAPSS